MFLMAYFDQNEEKVMMFPFFLQEFGRRFRIDWRRKYSYIWYQNELRHFNFRLKSLGFPTTPFWTTKKSPNKGDLIWSRLYCCQGSDKSHAVIGQDSLPQCIMGRWRPPCCENPHCEIPKYCCFYAVRYIVKVKNCIQTLNTYFRMASDPVRTDSEAARLLNSIASGNIADTVQDSMLQSIISDYFTDKSEQGTLYDSSEDSDTETSNIFDMLEQVMSEMNRVMMSRWIR